MSLNTLRETFEVKDNVSYGPVTQPQTPAPEPVYDSADILQQPVHKGNIAYGHIRPWL